MSDLISRQAILKHIEKIRQDALMIDDIRESSNIMRGMNLLEKAVRNQPSAQPEIIRCKDCKYITEHYDTDGNVPYWTCSEWDSGTDYDGFCHYAERRTDDSISD